MFSFSFPVQPAFCMTAVSSASQPAKPLVVVGVTYCRGEWGILQTDSVRKIIILMSPVLDAQTAWTDTDKNGWIMLVQKRYSWTKYQFIVLYCPRFNMCLSLIALSTVLAEPRCNMWGLLQEWQLHWGLHHARDRGHYLSDSTTKGLWQWRWEYGTKLCVFAQ